MEPGFPLKMPQLQAADSHRVVYRLSLASNSVVNYHHNQALKVITASQRIIQLLDL